MLLSSFILEGLIIKGQLNSTLKIVEPETCPAIPNEGPDEGPGVATSNESRRRKASRVPLERAIHQCVGGFLLVHVLGRLK